jgi:hypothetical protein
MTHVPHDVKLYLHVLQSLSNLGVPISFMRREAELGICE